MMKQFLLFSWVSFNDKKYTALCKKYDIDEIYFLSVSFRIKKHYLEIQEFEHSSAF